jgi:hypothetical protein
MAITKGGIDKVDLIHEVLLVRLVSLVCLVYLVYLVSLVCLVSLATGYWLLLTGFFRHASLQDAPLQGASLSLSSVMAFVPASP